MWVSLDTCTPSTFLVTRASVSGARASDGFFFLHPRTDVRRKRTSYKSSTVFSRILVSLDFCVLVKLKPATARLHDILLAVVHSRAAHLVMSASMLDDLWCPAMIMRSPVRVSCSFVVLFLKPDLVSQTHVECFSADSDGVETNLGRSRKQRLALFVKPDLVTQTHVECFSADSDGVETNLGRSRKQRLALFVKPDLVSQIHGEYHSAGSDCFPPSTLRLRWARAHNDIRFKASSLCPCRA